MILTKKKNLSRFWECEIEQMKQKAKAVAGGDEATADTVLDAIFGTKYGEYQDQLLESYVYEEAKEDRKLLQRFNSLWVIPLVAIGLPFQWLFTGKMGVDRKSKLGRVVLKLVGED